MTPQEFSKLKDEANSLFDRLRLRVCESGIIVDHDSRVLFDDFLVCYNEDHLVDFLNTHRLKHSKLFELAVVTLLSKGIDIHITATYGAKFVANRYYRNTRHLPPHFVQAICVLHIVRKWFKAIPASAERAFSVYLVNKGQGVITCHTDND